MKKLLLIPAFLFLLSPLIIEAQAQDRDYDWDDDDDSDEVENAFGIGPRLGYYSADDFDDGTMFYGLQIRAKMNDVLGIEGAVEYRPGNEASFATDGVEQSYETSLVPITGSLLLYLPMEANIAPYGVAGVGGYYTVYDADGDFFDDSDSEFNFGYHLGFGLEFPTNSNVSLSLDYRYLFLTPEGDNAPEDADFSGNAITASLMFYL